MTNIRSFHGFAPEISHLAYVDPSAQVIGHVQIGDDTSIWPCSVMRGDVHAIRIGCRTNIQDGALLHVTHDAQFTLGGFALTIGNDVTIGHGAALHGCSVQEASLIGMRATILDGTLVKRHSIIGAGAVVTQGKVVGEGELWLGNPARYVRMVTTQEIEQIYYTARQYVVLGANYRSEIAPVRPKLSHEFDRRALRV
ncbi:MAG: gamma carbonic anhydrase family protein [Dokdonella sp.]|uniref:gamma carbonic anhydrase family protein n=1 Tax=Dokdonella sp. TaxID=2291710 RepID=UPI003263D39C